jgi:Phosphoribosyl-AMP cyclohydrolase
MDLEEGSDFLPNFNQDGLLPVIVIDHQTNQVLMFAYTNAEALHLTLSTKQAHFYSRSRKKIWQKGEQSGNVQLVKQVYIDCDQDTLIFAVEQIGQAACHTGRRSCFYRVLEYEPNNPTQTRLKIIDNHKFFDPQEVYSQPKE